MLFSKWLQATGIPRTTAWRMWKAGHLKTFTRYGRTFITAQDSEAFLNEIGIDENQVLG